MMLLHKLDLPKILDIFEDERELQSRNKIFGVVKRVSKRDQETNTGQSPPASMLKCVRIGIYFYHLTLENCVLIDSRGVTFVVLLRLFSVGEYHPIVSV